MKRFVISALCLLAALLTAAMSVTAATVDLTDDGKTVVTYGDWVIEMTDDGWSLDEYTGSSASISIPRFIDSEVVVSLDNHCFANNATVRSVTTSSPLWTVGDYAFVDCTALASFGCNRAMREIGAGAFAGTSSLKSIDLETSAIAQVKPYTFLNSGVEVIRLPDTCTQLGAYSFAQCADLVKVVIPDSVTEIAETAFDRDENLVIYCNSDTYAHAYAEAQGIEYVLVDVPVAVSYLLGDADGNGRITILDATKIQRLLVRLVDDTDGMIALRGDSNQSGIDVMDATRIQRYLVGFTTSEPIGEETISYIYISY